MNQMRPPLSPKGSRSGQSLIEVRPTVIIAPELRGRGDFAVTRETGETEEDYQSRCEMVALVLDHAEKA